MFLPACVSVCCFGAWWPLRPEEGTESPGTSVTAGFKLPYGSWELNLDALEEQGVLLTTEPFYQPQELVFCVYRVLTQLTFFPVAFIKTILSSLQPYVGDSYALRLC